MIRKFLPLFTASLLALTLGGQGAYHPNARYAPETLREDMDILAASLKEIHPDLFQFISEEAFDAEVGRLKAELTDSLTELAFHLKVRELIAAIRCGHTYAKPSDAWYRYVSGQKILLPFDIMIHEGKMLVNRVYADSLPFRGGDELLSVAGLSSEEILSRMMKIQQRDGNHLGFVYRSIERNFRTYFAFLFNLAGPLAVAYSAGGEAPRLASVQFVSPGAAAIAPSGVPLRRDSVLMEGAGATFGISGRAGSPAVLRISGFKSRGYVKFYKEVFREIEDREINTLVIDLRNCGGGYFLHGNRLLRYLKKDKFSMHFHRPKGRIKKGPHLESGFFSRATRLSFRLMPDRQKNDRRDYVLGYKPFRRRHFDGKVYVLIDNGSFSLSSYFASRLDAEPNTTLIGEETGGGAAGTSAILWYKLVLPHTGIFVSIPEYYLDNDKPDAVFGRGLFPDQEMKRTVEDALGTADSWMERIFSEMGGLIHP
jgi:hypothetical protein